MNETLPTEKMLIGLTVLQAGCLSAQTKVNFPSPDTGWAVGAGGTMKKQPMVEKPGYTKPAKP